MNARIFRDIDELKIWGNNNGMRFLRDPDDKTKYKVYFTDDDVDKLESFVRQQQTEIEELEKENTDLRYLIATKLEQQDGISLNSMAHPITNTPEPSYEIDPNKLETIEIDLPSPEPVAWMLLGLEDRKPKLINLQVIDHLEGTWIPLYTHPSKDLTDEEITQIVSEKLETWNTKESMIDFARAILRKAQEK